MTAKDGGGVAIVFKEGRRALKNRWQHVRGRHHDVRGLAEADAERLVWGGHDPASGMRGKLLQGAVMTRPLSAACVPGQ